MADAERQWHEYQRSQRRHILAHRLFGIIVLPILGAVCGLSLVGALRLFLISPWFILWVPGALWCGTLLWVVHTITGGKPPTAPEAAPDA